jgi:uncharacterized membrane protein YphA (DoxX/SURF4 family)
MRIVATIALLNQAVIAVRANGLNASSAPALLASAGGIFLLVGLWTPVTGAIVAIVEFWSVLSHTGDLWIGILLGSICAALALLGPGGYSVDAYIFGWRRIDIRD